ncbi:hypothetical protein Taro_024275 [Colocasia esculenta]|uniref:Ion transport domain-containing protein n=1 Tax=Colocasia esculenta TaxID=4460 RepID=A0A843VD77_COLES|nr:hypothetical protein [Colocasia esculenta]
MKILKNLRYLDRQVELPGADLFVGGVLIHDGLLDDLDPRLSLSSDTGRMNRCGFNIDRLGHSSNNTPMSFKTGMRKGSEGLKSLGRSLRFGVSRAVFPEDLKVSEKKIFDPQDKFLRICNRLFVISCILAVSVDPLFLYLPVVDQGQYCLGIDRKLAITTTTVRTIVDAFYLIRIALQFRTAYIAPSSRVFGRGELVIDTALIAKRYLKWHFIVDFLSVLPLPQILIWRLLQSSDASDVLATKNALFFIVLIQYIPRFLRFLPLTSELKRTSGVFAETAWAGAAYYLLWYILASHIVGAFWYFLAVEREIECWHEACISPQCVSNYLYCGNHHSEGYQSWSNIRKSIIDGNCTADDVNGNFPYGIYSDALTSGVVASKKFVSKYCYCLWWGLRNLRGRVVSSGTGRTGLAREGRLLTLRGREAVATASAGAGGCRLRLLAGAWDVRAGRIGSEQRSASMRGAGLAAGATRMEHAGAHT